MLAAADLCECEARDVSLRELGECAEAQTVSAVYVVSMLSSSIETGRSGIRRGSSGKGVEKISGGGCSGGVLGVGDAAPGACGVGVVLGREVAAPATMTGEVRRGGGSDGRGVESSAGGSNVTEGGGDGGDGNGGIAFASASQPHKTYSRPTNTLLGAPATLASTSVRPDDGGGGCDGGGVTTAHPTEIGTETPTTTSGAMAATASGIRVHATQGLFASCLLPTGPPRRTGVSRLMSETA